MATTDPGQLAPHSSAELQLIPLHRHDHVDARGVKRGKSPSDPNWTGRDYSSFDAAAHMAAGGNVGVRLSARDLVVDVDPRNFPDGETLVTANPFRRLCASVGLDPDHYPTVETGSGGLHLYMTKPTDVALLDTHPDYPGVEFKSRGRQVVAAGSVHPDTLATYAWDPLGMGLSASGAPEAPSSLVELARRPTAAASTGGGEYDAEQLAAMLDRLDPTDFRDQDRWLDLMMACHHATDGDGRQEFIDWSTGDPAYADDAGRIGARWDSLHRANERGGPSVTVRTLHKFLTDVGGGDAIPRTPAADDFAEVLEEDVSAIVSSYTQKPGSGVMPAIHEGGLQIHPKTSVAPDNYANALKAVYKSGLGPRFDELKQRVVLMGTLPWGEQYGRILDDKVLLMARTWLMQRFQGNDYQPSKDNVFDALTAVAYLYKFNPIIDYLDSLKWDGLPRVASLFDRGFQCGRDEYTEAVSQCFMIGSVARQRDPGCKFDTMPVVKGRQGVLKSSGFRVLFSTEWFSDAELGDLKHKDAPMNLEGIWVHEFAELAGLRASDMNVLKAFLSRAADRYRSPYGRSIADHPRRSVFVGTVNEGGYLSDPTGSRRFWPLEVKPGERVDVEWIRANRDQLWAEADTLYKCGESPVLPEHLWALAADRQAQETVEDPWADQIAEMLRLRAELRRDFEAKTGIYEVEVIDGKEVASPCGEPPRLERLHTQELLAYLKLDGDRQNHAHAQRLRRVMESKGWKYQRSVRVGARIAAGYVFGDA